MEIAPGVSVDRDVMHGAAVINGTRIPVSIIVGSLGSGMTRDDIIREYDLSERDIDSALAYAGEVLARTIDFPLPVSPVSRLNPGWNSRSRLSIRV